MPQGGLDVIFFEIGYNNFIFLTYADILPTQMIRKHDSYLDNLSTIHGWLASTVICMYLINHLLESIPISTIGTIHDYLALNGFRSQCGARCQNLGHLLLVVLNYDNKIICI